MLRKGLGKPNAMCGPHLDSNLTNQLLQKNMGQSGEFEHQLLDNIKESFLCGCVCERDRHTHKGIVVRLKDNKNPHILEIYTQVFKTEVI